MDYSGKLVALAVTANKEVTEADVRRMIDSEVNRSPEFREAAAAIDCIRIECADVDPADYSQDVAGVYLWFMRPERWKLVDNLHIFEYLEEPPVYIAFPI